MYDFKDQITPVSKSPYNWNYDRDLKCMCSRDILFVPFEYCSLTDSNYFVFLAMCHHGQLIIINRVFNIFNQRHGKCTTGIQLSFLGLFTQYYSEFEFEDHFCAYHGVFIWSTCDVCWLNTTYGWVFESCIHTWIALVYEMSAGWF